MKVIGLTGGIGSGKSTVSQYLIKLGYDVIDADKISHDITMPGHETLKKLKEEFGDSIILSDGSLDRKELGKIAFSDSLRHKRLEEIVTDSVINIVNSKIKEFREENKDIVILDAPLLFESCMDKKCDEVWLVTSSLEERVKRVMARDGLSREEILDRIDNQMPDNEKIKRSTCVIKNDGPLDDLYRTIDFILRMK